MTFGAEWVSVTHAKLIRQEWLLYRRRQDLVAGHCADGDIPGQIVVGLQPTMFSFASLLPKTGMNYEFCPLLVQRNSAR
ncbi:MAG: hypothetical protein ACLFWL_15275 [Candidatus Brocadiia bacterium]